MHKPFWTTKIWPGWQGGCGNLVRSKYGPKLPRIAPYCIAFWPGEVGIYTSTSWLANQTLYPPIHMILVQKEYFSDIIKRNVFTRDMRDFSVADQGIIMRCHINDKYVAGREFEAKLDKLRIEKYNPTVMSCSWSDTSIFLPSPKYFPTSISSFLTLNEILYHCDQHWKKN